MPGRFTIYVSHRFLQADPKGSCAEKGAGSWMHWLGFLTE